MPGATKLSVVADKWGGDYKQRQSVHCSKHTYASIPFTGLPLKTVKKMPCQ